MNPDEAHRQHARDYLDTHILLLCLNPKTSGELADALAVRASLAGLARLYNHLASLLQRRLLVARAELVDGQRVTVWATKARQALRAQPQTAKAILGALGPAPQTTTQVARVSGLHHDTALAALTALAKIGLAVHTQGAKKTSPHLWALAVETP